LDTVILVLKKREVIFLHEYHHAATLALTWIREMAPSSLPPSLPPSLPCTSNCKHLRIHGRCNRRAINLSSLVSHYHVCRDGPTLYGAVGAHHHQPPRPHVHVLRESCLALTIPPPLLVLCGTPSSLFWVQPDMHAFSFLSTYLSPSPFAKHCCPNTSTYSIIVPEPPILHLDNCSTLCWLLSRSTSGGKSI